MSASSYFGMSKYQEVLGGIASDKFHLIGIEHRLDCLKLGGDAETSCLDIDISFGFVLIWIYLNSLPKYMASTASPSSHFLAFLKFP
jgi:hypothetical protein